METKIEITEINGDQGKYYSVWFWIDDKLTTHIGYYDSRIEAKWAGNAVIEAVEKTRDAIRKAI